MNTGQMMLTLGALILLSLLALRVNSSQLSTQDTMQNSKFGILAISVASSIMETASEKAFDEKSIGNAITSVTSLTPKGSFGTESGENSDSSDTFDDFDDFDGYTATIADMPSAIFNVNCTVNYVDPDVAGFITTSNSWHKQLVVRVTSSSMVDTIKMTKIFSYWKFP